VQLRAERRGGPIEQRLRVDEDVVEATAAAHDLEQRGPGPLGLRLTSEQVDDRLHGVQRELLVAVELELPRIAGAAPASAVGDQSPRAIARDVSIGEFTR
jgi:hypothetical protein